MMIALFLAVIFFAVFVVRRELLSHLLAWGLERRKRVGERAFTAYVIPDYITGKPYITRFQFPRMFGFRPMIHLIHRADHDRHLHDHPWDWSFSIVLVGSYDEERINCVQCKGKDHSGTVLKIRRARFWNLLRGDDFHRITELHGDVFTLFVAGPRKESDQWGFLTPSGWVESSEYIASAKSELAARYRRPTRN